MAKIKIKTIDDFSEKRPELKIDSSSEQIKNPVTLVSRLDHPITISYNGEGMVIPPRARLVIADKNKLGALPGGITLLK